MWSVFPLTDYAFEKTAFNIFPPVSGLNLPSRDTLRIEKVGWTLLLVFLLPKTGQTSLTVGLCLGVVGLAGMGLHVSQSFWVEQEGGQALPRDRTEHSLPKLCPCCSGPADL